MTHWIRKIAECIPAQAATKIELRMLLAGSLRPSLVGFYLVRCIQIKLSWRWGSFNRCKQHCCEAVDLCIIEFNYEFLLFSVRNIFLGGSHCNDEICMARAKALNKIQNTSLSINIELSVLEENNVIIGICEKFPFKQTVTLINCKHSGYRCVCEVGVERPGIAHMM